MDALTNAGLSHGSFRQFFYVALDRQLPDGEGVRTQPLSFKTDRLEVIEPTFRALQRRYPDCFLAGELRRVC